MEPSQFEPFLEEIKTFLTEEIIAAITDFTIKRINYLEINRSNYEKWIKQISELKTNEELFFQTSEYHSEIEKSLHKEKNELLNNELFSIINLFEIKIDKFIQPIAEEVILNQQEQHFTASKDDKFHIKNLKKIKKINFSIAKKTKQIFKGKEYKYTWKRNVPLKGMLIHFFKVNYLSQILKLLSVYLENVGKLYLDTHLLSNEIDKTFTDKNFQYLKDEEKKNFEEVIVNYEIQTKELTDKFLELVESQNDQIITSYELEYNKFITQYEIVDTIEAFRSVYAEKKITAELEEYNKNLIDTKKFSQLYFEAVFDRIEYYRDLLWFTNLLISKSFAATNSANEYYLKIVNTKIKAITEVILKSKYNIENNKNAFVSIVTKEKNLLLDTLDRKIVVDLVNSVTNSKDNLFLINYKNDLREKLDEFGKNYKFVRPGQLQFKLDDGDLKEFSPKEIISPIILNKLNNKIEILEKDFEVKTSKVIPSIIGLARIVEFNLDSALSKQEENSDLLEEAKEIAVSGLDRSKNKVDDIRKEIENIYSEIRSNLDSEIKELLLDLFALSNIERLLSIKLQVSKEKALQEANEKFQLYVEKINKGIEWTYNKIIHYLNFIKERTLGITSRVGLSTQDVELSEAMADYLVQVSSSMEKLPFVYRRLFAGDALTDSRIFIGREKEIEKLSKAYNYWQNNQISSVMLIGEKGSGTSSLISIALDKLSVPNTIYRKKSSKTIYKEEDLLTYLKELLEINSITSIDELIEQLQKLETRIIIIVENFENFFLKIVEGFDSAKQMLEIVTSTSRNVLWILTCNTFAWNYLDKVVGIKDFFIFNIHMTGLTERTLKEIILLRHNISGYDVTYLSSPALEKQKAFKKLDDKEKQMFLEKEYFENLHKIASNNIGIALFLWLRSIKNADEEEIKISSDVELDFSFLKELSDQKLFSIMALILHDGLSLEEHSVIFNLSLKSSRLLFATLLDDGIIFLKDTSYKVNFQLYKPLVNLLKSKNILH
jgi:hypothetical protein